MLSNISAFPWFDKLILPVIYGLIITVIVTRIGAINTNIRGKFTKRRAKKLLKRATLVIGAEVRGVSSALLSVMISHLMIRTTVFIAAVVVTSASFVLATLGNDSNQYYPVIMMGFLSGVVLVLVDNTWTEISNMSLALIAPNKIIDDLEKKLTPAHRDEFKDDLEKLRSAASEIEKQRDGRIAMATIAHRFVFEREANPPATSDATTAGAKKEIISQPSA